MSNAAWIISFKLKKNVSHEDFVEATKLLHDEIISKAKGFISWKQYLQGDTWTDFVTWESLEDANNGVEVGQGSEAVKDFYALIQMNTCRMQISTLVESY